MDGSAYQHLLRRYFEGKATEAETVILMAWIQHPENASAVKAAMDGLWELDTGGDPIFSKTESAGMLAQILHAETEAGEEPAMAPHRPARRRRILYGSFAAVLLVAIALGIRFFTTQKPTRSMEQSVSLGTQDVAPGGNKAILTLGNGTTLSLDTVPDGTFAVQGTAKISKREAGRISYLQQSRAHPHGVVPQNTLATPRGGQFEVVLPDGSRVWLNADSRLKFPTVFTGNRREVAVSGEAYFEIAPDPRKPFWVNVTTTSGEMRIQVLGTAFNVNGYTNEPTIRTTLITGAVSVLLGNQRETLRPGQQASIAGAATHISVTTANPKEVIAWKNGFFHFEHDDIRTVMRQLARWYNVQVIYQGSVPTGHFTGIVDRQSDLSQVLKVLALSGVHFTIKNRTIIVYS